MNCKLDAPQRKPVYRCSRNKENRQMGSILEDSNNLSRPGKATCIVLAALSITGWLALTEIAWNLAETTLKARDAEKTGQLLTYLTYNNTNAQPKDPTNQRSRMWEIEEETQSRIGRVVGTKKQHLKHAVLLGIIHPEEADILLQNQTDQ